MRDNEIEMHRLRTEHAQLRAELARRHSLSDALPASTHPSRTAHFATSSQVTTSSSRRPRSSTTTQSTGRHHHTTRRDSDPIAEEFTESKPSVKAPSKLYVIVPGAPASRKVVPTSSASSRLSGHRDPFYSLDDAAIDDVDHVSLQNANVPTIRTPPYGFMPSVGYVHNQPAPSARAHDSEGTAGQLVLYGQSHQIEPASQDDPRTPRSTDVAPSLLIGASGEGAPIGTDWNYIGNAISQNPNMPTSSVATIATAGRSHRASRSISSSLSGLGLHATTSSSGRQLTQGGARADAPSPEPSMASSWGTVPSHRTSRSASVQDLHLTGLPAAMDELDLSSGPSTGNTSLADLRLTRLPDLATDNASLPGPASSFHSADVAPVTPRALTWHTDVISQAENATHSVLPSGRPHADYRARGTTADLDVLTPRIRHSSTEVTTLGLSLSTSNNTSRLHISGANDLNQVNRSLLAAASESRVRASQRRHSRAVSMSDAEDYSASEPRVRVDHSGNSDNVQSDNHTSIHRPPAASHRSSFSSGTNIVVPHTDRISGPPQLPSASQPRESHGDRNRQRRRSSVTASHSSAVSSRDIYDVRQPSPEVIRQASMGYAPSFSHSQNQSRPASVYPLQASSSMHSNSSVGSGSSLGLSIAPPGPGASAATTASGEPSTIRAPRPVNGLQSGNILTFWDRRG